MTSQLPLLLLHQEVLTASIDAMFHAISFRDIFKLWSLTAAFLPNGDVTVPDSAFEALTGLLEAWSAHLAPLSGTAKVLRIAWATEQLTGAMDALSDDGHYFLLAQLDELEEKTAAAEFAAQRFRQAHAALAKAVSQALETGSDTLPSGVVQARNVTFG